VKLGLEFFSAQGPEGVRRIADLGLPIFLDVKLHDIPNTVAKAVEALAPLDPAILTVHAAGGHEMLLAAKRAAPPTTKVVAVTLLTSLDAADLNDLGIERSPADQVARARSGVSMATKIGFKPSAPGFPSLAPLARMRCGCAPSRPHGAAATRFAPAGSTRSGESRSRR
jgi:orotidine-5'-phosphate decarboxylase